MNRLISACYFVFLIVVAGIVIYVLPYVRISPYVDTGKKSPAISEESPLTKTAQVAGIPWDISLDELLKLAPSRGLWKVLDSSVPPQPYNYDTGVTFSGTYAGYQAEYIFFFIPQFRDELGPQGLRSIHVECRYKDIPIENLYAAIHEELEKKFGPPVDKDFPPWHIVPLFNDRDRINSDKTQDAWETTSENGEHIVVVITLRPKSGFARFSAGMFSVAYHKFHSKPTSETFFRSQNIMPKRAKYPDGGFYGNAKPGSSRYEGEFANTLPEGKGRIAWASGSTYEGDWIKGRRTGQGVYTWSTGLTYRGDFIDDEMHGKGICTWPDGTWYEGDWQHKRRTGKGVLVWANGDRYTGDFLNDSPHGKGTLIYSNGNSVTGAFAFGVLQRPAPIGAVDGSPTLDGSFKVTALPDGNVLIEYPNGNFYKGAFCEGWLEGNGVFTFADGTSLSGTFHTNRFVYGKKTYTDGTYYVGSLTEYYSKLKDGKQHNSSKRLGFGTQYASNGTILNQGRWVMDDFVYSIVPSESPQPVGPDDKDILREVSPRKSPI